MAELTAKFQIIDEMSDKLVSIAEIGGQMIEKWEQAGGVISSAFEEMTRAAEDTANAANNASDIMNEYEDSINDGTKSIEEFEDAAKRAGDEAGNAGDEFEDMGDRFEDAGDDAENAGDRGVAAIQSISEALAAAGIAALIGEAADALREAAEAAGVAETAFAKLQTIAGENSMSMLTGQIKELSSETAISQDALANVAYDAISAGRAVEDAVGTAEAASKLAAAGFTETSAALSVLSTAMNSYGEAAGTAEEISNSLIMVQNLGVTTVADLAASMGKSISMASAFSVSLSNLESAYVSITKTGINTAEATTYISAMMSELGKAGTEVSNILIEATGESFGQLMQEGWTLADTLGILYDSVDQNAEAMMNLWSSQTAGVAAAAIVNQGLEQFNTNLGLIRDSAGATESAYKTMADTFEYSQRRIAVSAENLKIAVGDRVKPAFERLNNAFSELFDGMTRLVEEHPIMTKAIIALGTGAGAAATGIAAFTAATAAAKAVAAAFGVEAATMGAAVKGLALAINSALGPVGWVTIGIGALTTAVGAFLAMQDDAADETEGMTAATRKQYYELQDLNKEYEETSEKLGKTSPEALKLKYEMDSLSSSFESGKKTAEGFKNEIDEVCSSVYNSITNFNNTIDEIDEDKIVSMSLINRYEKLAGSAALGASGQQELRAVTEKLAEAFPGLAKGIDKDTLSTEEYVEALEKACEQEAEERKQAAARDEYVAAYERRTELIREMTAAQKEYDAAVEAHKNDLSYGFFEGSEVKEAREELERLEAAQRENEGTLSRIQNEWKEAARAEQEAEDGVASYGDVVNNTLGSAKENLENLCVTYDEAYQSALESLGGQFSLFDTASTSLENYVNATVDNVQKALDSQLAYWESYENDIERIKNTTAADLGLVDDELGTAQEKYDALMTNIQNGSEEAAGLARSIAANLEEGNEESVAKLANTAAEVASKREEIANETAEWVTGLEKTMEELKTDINSTIEDMNLQEKANAAAKSTMQGYINGLVSEESVAVSTAQRIAQKVAAVFATIPKANAAAPTESTATTPMHAGGTTSAESAFIAGEEGPELILGREGSTVFPHEETEKIVQAVSNSYARTDVVNQYDYGRTDKLYVPYPEEKESDNSKRTETKKILIEIGGKGSIELKGGKNNKEEIKQILYENLKPSIIEILMQEIYEEGDYSYGY